MGGTWHWGRGRGGGLEVFIVAVDRLWECGPVEHRCCRMGGRERYEEVEVEDWGRLSQ